MANKKSKYGHPYLSLDSNGNTVSILSFGSVCAHGLPRCLSGKESTCQGRRPRFNPWVRKTPWRRKWQLTPVSLPGKSHRQRSLVGNSPWGHKESDTTEWLSTHTCVHIPTCAHSCILHKWYMNTFIWWNVQTEKSRWSKEKACLPLLLTRQACILLGHFAMYLCMCKYIVRCGSELVYLHTWFRPYPALFYHLVIFLCKHPADILYTTPL